MFKKIGPAIALSTMLIFSVACERAEIVDRYYPNYEQLGTSGEPGNWVPTFIPRSAVEIRARYKIDTGAELLMFYLGKPEDLSLAGHCKKATVGDVQLPASGFLNVAWWPDSLFQNRTNSEDLARYEFYRCERQAFFALKRANGRPQAFYWQISLNQQNMGSGNMREHRTDLPKTWGLIFPPNNGHRDHATFLASNCSG